MNTSTFTIDSAGNPDPITVAADCSKVTIREHQGANTTWQLYMPAITSTPVRKEIGEGHVFEATRHEGRFSKGRILGYADVPSGTVTFLMICE